MRISEATRRRLVDELQLAKISWSGGLNEVEFLGRLYDLSKMRSTDRRFSDAAGDIWQHRVNNVDWDEYWVLTDPRFEILHSDDEEFLRFLCEMVHPLVRNDDDETRKIVEIVNKHLARDGFEIAPSMIVSGHAIYSGRQRVHGELPTVKTAKKTAEILESSYLSQQITRMESAIETDPEAAIGAAKEFVESICKAILEKMGALPDENADLPKLVKQTLQHLALVPDRVPDAAKGRDAAKRILNNLGTLADGIAELRNKFGTGHGKHPSTKGLEPRHARLAVGSATTLGVFVFETFQKRAGAK